MATSAFCPEQGTLGPGPEKPGSEDSSNSQEESTVTGLQTIEESNWTRQTTKESTNTGKGSNLSGSSSRGKSDEDKPTKEKKDSKAQFTFVRPRAYMLVVGCLLAVCAGTVNSIAVKILGSKVSHVTGSVTEVGVQLEGILHGGDEDSTWYKAALLVVFFIIGAFLCGLLVDKNELHFGKAFYGNALMGNSALLIAAAFIGHEEGTHMQDYATYCAAVACGLQNAMCTSHFGAVVRTTHVTGTATDIGSTAGRVCAILMKRGCRRRRLTSLDKAEIDADGTKLVILLLMFLGFLNGTLFGAFLAEWHSSYAFLVPAAITGTVGFVYVLFRRNLKKCFKEWSNRDEIEQEMEEVEHEVEHALEDLDKITRNLTSATTTAEQAGIRHVAANLMHVLEEIKRIEADLVQSPDPENPAPARPALSVTPHDGQLPRSAGNWAV
jgi:uncharacterized membrane protein YoaK (UPF0700 family)